MGNSGHSDQYSPQGISSLVKILNPSIQESVISSKKAGDVSRSVATNDAGQFELIKLSPGDYLLTVDEHMLIDNETILTVGGNERKGWDGTVKGGSIDNTVEQKGWDGTVKGGSIDNAAERKGWDGSVKGSGNATDQLKVNTTKSNTKDFLLALDELDEMLSLDKSINASELNNLKQTIASLRTSVKEQIEALQNASTETLAAETNFALLLGSLQRAGSPYDKIRGQLKTKHDTAKNSVGNIR
jgi:hypothetical protein